MADNPIEHSRTKHIDIRHHFLRDHQQKGDIEVYHISTENQLTDIFTKPLDEKTFCRLRMHLNPLLFICGAQVVHVIPGPHKSICK
jgi:hypothetical protein